jgi:hypothetical protein
LFAKRRNSFEKNSVVQENLLKRAVANDEKFLEINIKEVIS